MNQFAIIDPARDKANDECGVFGIYKNNDELDVVSITHDALYSLQHRGHVSAGITVNDNRRFFTVKELGCLTKRRSPSCQTATSPSVMCATP